MDRPTSDNLDLIIIGAGINGTGIARDAALRGLRVVLLDKGDISSGTTGWSTRLIHGGLRYLEHAEIGLVRESLAERETLLHIAPHLVRPLRLIIPIYRHARRGRLTIGAGMAAYDLLSRGKSLPNHQMLNRSGALELAPGLNPDQLAGAATYFDCQVEYAERIAVENAISAAENGAIIKTYCRVDRLIIEDGRVTGVEFTDVLDRSSHRALAPVVANVAGPWVDQVLKGLDPKPSRLIGGTKGSHIIVSRFEGAPSDAIYTEARSDGRPFFIIPWNGLWLIGTTDILYTGDLDCVSASDEEIAYLIQETNRVIPSANLTARSVLYTYSGVRPLPYAGDKSEGAITRRHIIHDHSSAGGLNGLISIAGGKLTTFRNLAQSVVDLVFKKLGRLSAKANTADIPLPGAATSDFTKFAGEFMSRSGLPPKVADHLLRVYGIRAADVVELAREDPSLMTIFSDEAGAIGAEILMAFGKENARTLSDVMLRRTMAGLGPSVGIGDDARAARICRTYLGWDESRADEEIKNYRAYIQRYRPNVVDGAN